MQIKRYFETHYKIGDKHQGQHLTKDYEQIVSLINRQRMVTRGGYHSHWYLVDRLGVDMYLSFINDPMTKGLKDTYQTKVFYIFTTGFIYDGKEFRIEPYLKYIVASEKMYDDDRIEFELGGVGIYLYRLKFGN